MSGARAEIFRRLRAAAGPAADAATIEVAARALLTRVPATLPERLPGTAAEAFWARVSSAAFAATAARIATLADLPAAVRRYLAAQNLAPEIALQPHPELQGLDWEGVAVTDRITIDQPAAVGLALGGIAETGSLVFHSSPSTPTLFAFLPLHHIVAVRAGTIWAGLEDYAAARHPAPRNVNLITGASGTTDIEGTLVRGAHGPGFLHIVMVAEESAFL